MGFVSGFASQVCMATKMYNRNTQMVFIKRNAEQSSRAGQLLSWDRLSKLVRAMAEGLNKNSMSPNIISMVLLSADESEAEPLEMQLHAICRCYS